MLFLFPSLAIGDVVYIFPEGKSSKAYSIDGEILDLTGREIVIRKRGNREGRFPVDSIARIETQWPQEYKQGLVQADEGKFQKAAALFEAAIRGEKRTWARRKIMGELLVCYLATGRVEKACSIYLAIAASDPTTRAVNDIPVAWFGNEAVNKGKAAEWMESADSFHAKLLGASYLLTTAQRSKAMNAFRVVAQQKQNPTLAAIAVVQLWRAKVLTAKEQEVNGWQQYLESIPLEARAGAYFVVAQAKERLGEYDQAMLHYMRVPIHFKNNRLLAARALLAAARTAELSGKTVEAKQLLLEVLRNYPKTQEYVSAEQSLKSLEAKSKK